VTRVSVRISYMNSNQNPAANRGFLAITALVALVILGIAGHVLLDAIGDTADQLEQLRTGAGQWLTLAAG